MDYYNCAKLWRNNAALSMNFNGAHGIPIRGHDQGEERKFSNFHFAVLWEFSE